MPITRGHAVRLVIVITVFVVAAWLLLPWLFFDIRSNGTINARLVIVQAPIEGTVVQTPPDVGTFVSQGDVLTQITDERGSRGIIVSLDTEREMLINRVTALKEKLVALEALKQRLFRQAATHKEETTTNLRYQFMEAEARQRYWESVRQERELNHNRMKKLTADGYAPAVRVEQAESLLNQAHQEVVRATADVDRLRQEIKVAGEGIYLRDGRNDVPYSQQRLDELVIAAADLKVQIAETEGRLKAVERGFQDEMVRAGRRQEAIVLAPVTGTVWRRFVSAQGLVVRNGDILKILDCSKLLAEVAVPESVVDRISIGQILNVRLQGASQTHQAKVLDIRGTRAVTPGIEYAAAPPLLKKDEALLTAQITDSKLNPSAEKFCNVGRRVELRLPSIIFGGN
ncbi:MAG: HlyD family efflux transporter periplasmic adaptor subunit [Rhodospirillaceae bacterium]|nr:HlyD family efflux transporter periplasmic adaptor subunit [Rhodospirillaceae bacterium]